VLPTFWNPRVCFASLFLRIAGVLTGLLAVFAIVKARLSWVSSVRNFPSDVRGRTLRIHRRGFVSRVSATFPSSYQYPPLPGAIFSHSRTHCSRQLLACASPERALHHPPRTTAPARFLRLHLNSLSHLLVHLSISPAVGFVVCGRFARRIVLVMVTCCGAREVSFRLI